MIAATKLKDICERAAGELADADAGTALAWTAKTFGNDWVVASNMQDAVLVDLAVRVRPDVPVLFLDTGYHFVETIGMRDAVTTVYPTVRLIEARPAKPVSVQEEEFGPLYRTDPDRCCHLRKVVPLRRVLTGFSAWVTGVRRSDGPGRADIPVVAWDERHGLVKVNPLATWSDEQYRRYLDEQGVLENTLVAAGYPSIGCAPCTSRPFPGADARSGRWAGRGKTECGLHG